MNKKAVVLLSGGLDSATILYYARVRGYQAWSIVFRYGQRHNKEVVNAKRVARRAGCPLWVVDISLPWKGSALLDRTTKLPHRTKIDPREIPVTYVPARNIIFLSFAASFAETIGARKIFIGANAVDYSGYPDCRPEFFSAYQKALDRGLKSGVQHRKIKIAAPLLRKSKAQIIRLGMKLRVPYELTWSCYAGGERPCGACDSCRLRAKGFEEAGTVDPALKRIRRN